MGAFVSRRVFGAKLDRFECAIGRLWTFTLEVGPHGGPTVSG